MHTDEQYGHQLAAQLRREIDDVQAGPDLVSTLRRRRATRTWTTRAAIGTPLVAAAAAVIVVTTAGPGAPVTANWAGTAGQHSTSSGAPQMEDVAYVQEQTIKALARASQFVIFAQNTWSAGHYDVWTDKATQRYRNDVYMATAITDGVSTKADGKAVAPPSPTAEGPIHPSQSHSVAGPEGNQTVVTVDYDQKWWSTGHLTDKRPTDEPDITDADSIREAISKGTVELLGREKVNNINTLHLRLYGPKRAYRIDMWVDAANYLPVKETAAKGGDMDYPAEATITTTFSWLPRTQENLAKLVLTPPPGFTRK